MGFVDFDDHQARGGAPTGRASSRCSSTRSSPRAAAWSSCRCAAPKYDIARFGAEFPRFSPRQADLLIVVGTITERQGPALRRIYEQMCEPKWVIAFGVCASTGGFYQNYSTMPGADQVDPGRRLHPRLPAAARAGARRPDPAAGEDPARRGPQPDRDRKREQRPATRRAARRVRPIVADRARQQAEGATSRWRRSSSTARRRSSRAARSSRPASQHGDEWARVRRDAWVAVATFLRDDPATEDGDVHRPHRASIASAPSRASRSCCTSARSATKHRVRLNGGVPEDDPHDRHARARVWAGAELVRARGVRPVRRPLQGPPRSAPHPHVPGVRRAPAAQGLPEGEAAAARAPRQPMADRPTEHERDHDARAADTRQRRARLPGRRGSRTSPSCRPSR